MKSTVLALTNEARSDTYAWAALVTSMRKMDPNTRIKNSKNRLGPMKEKLEKYVEKEIAPLYGRKNLDEILETNEEFFYTKAPQLFCPPQQIFNKERQLDLLSKRTTKGKMTLTTKERKSLFKIDRTQQDKVIPMTKKEKKESIGSSEILQHIDEELDLGDILPFADTQSENDWLEEHPIEQSNLRYGNCFS